MTYVFLPLILILTFVQTDLIYLGINAINSFIICSANLVYCTFQFTSLTSLPFTPWVAWKQEPFSPSTRAFCQAWSSIVLIVWIGEKRMREWMQQWVTEWTCQSINNWVGNCPWRTYLILKGQLHYYPYLTNEELEPWGIWVIKYYIPLLLSRNCYAPGTLLVCEIFFKGFRIQIFVFSSLNLHKMDLNPGYKLLILQTAKKCEGL